MGTTDEDDILYAAMNGDVQAITKCVSRGENVNTRDKPSLFGRTPLHYAAGSGYNDVCELLLKKGADVNALDKNGRSSLHYTAKRGHTSICEMFVQRRRVSLDQTDKFGDTPLVTAASWRSWGVCETLIQAGASVVSKNQLGHTALHEASQAGNLAICWALINAGANLSATDKEGNTALHIACAKGHTHVCQLLLDTGADAAVKNQDGDTVLHSAASGNYKMCQIILQKSGDCNARNKIGNTPLHIAASVNSADVCALFVAVGADCLITNNDDKTARSMLPRLSGNAEKILSQAEKRQKYEKLIQIGTEPIPVVKLFLIGSPKVGKTTLQNALVKKPQSWLPGKWQSLNDSADYQPTPGIELCTKYVPGAGTFAFWDCAGQLQYHVTHAMFLGAQNCIYVVVYDITQAKQIEELRRWLAFVKAGHDYTYQTNPDVIIVATHLDQIGKKTDGKALPGSILKQVSQEFGDYLNIASDVIAINSINFGSKEMTQLRCVLQCVASRIKGRRVMPRLCNEIRRVKHEWYKSGFPVISWDEFGSKVKSINRLADDSLLRTAAIFLTDISEIYFKKECGEQDWVVLDPKWLSREIIGRIFEKEDVPTCNSTNLLANKQLYSVSDIRTLLHDVGDIHHVLDLLEHFELVYKYDDARYVIPAKLPMDLDFVVWRMDGKFTVYYGRRIECVNATDIFTPDIFPNLQVRIMRYFCHAAEEVQISRKSVKFSCQIEGFIQLTHDQRAIDICVRGRPGLNDRKACHTQLVKVLEMVQSELENISPGTAVKICYLSPRSLVQHDNFDEILYYTDTDIVTVKQDTVIHHETGKTESLADILCLGYDSTILQRCGFECKSVWLLEDDLKALCNCLDIVHPLGQDYRALAEALNVSEYELDCIYQICLHKSSSPTRALLERVQPSLQHLRAVCKHPGLVANDEAANIIDKALERYGHKVNHKDPKCVVEEKFLPESVNTKVLLWREDLRLRASSLRATLHPDILLASSPLLFEVSDREQIQATMKSLGRTKAVERMLYTVLKSQCVKIHREFYTALEMEEGNDKVVGAPTEVLPDASGLYVNHIIPPANPSKAMLDPLNNYCMWTGRKGLAYVLNNSRLKNKERHGSDVDLVNICHVLRELGYELQVHTNLTAQEMSDTLVKFTSRFEGNDYCSSIVVLMSHGKTGVITGSDQKPVKLKHIYSMFESHRCPALLGKPKLFFVQACRGDSKKLMEADADISECEGEQYSDYEEETVSDIRPDYSFAHDLPANADMFFAYATTEGRQSLRHQVDGSWFIQALCEIFIQRASCDSLDDLMNKVTNRVAGQRGQIWDPVMGKPKTASQTPECIKRMRKTMYFLPKYP